jgi:hypothetical protein
MLCKIDSLLRTDDSLNQNESSVALIRKPRVNFHNMWSVLRLLKNCVSWLRWSNVQMIWNATNNCSYTVPGRKADRYNTSLHQVTIHIQKNHFLFLFHFILIMTKTFLIIYFKEYNCIQVFINIYERLTEMERAWLVSGWVVGCLENFIFPRCDVVFYLTRGSGT